MSSELTRNTSNPKKCIHIPTKRITAVVIALFIMLLFLPCETIALEPYSRGDVDGNGIIGVSDYIGIRLHLLGVKTLSGEALEASDINGDGRITVTDYISVKLHLLGIISLGSETGTLLRPKAFGEPKPASSLESCTVEYVKRTGGKYIYCNNPEALRSEDINVMLLKEENMSGGYFFTFEHANYTGKSVYLGFRIVNTGTENITVSVHNIGYQTEGDGYGIYEWNDFYGVDFERPWTGENVPIVYDNTEYTVPAGEYIYVIGGTSADAYNNINVGNTADNGLSVYRVANGAVYFTVSGGSAEGQFCCYDDAENISEVTEEQGYVTNRNGRDFSRQYKGSAPYTGVIDASFAWTVDDSVENSTKLPVNYKVSYASDAKTAGYKAYEEYNIDVVDKEIISDSWHTHLSVNSSHTAIDTDMMPFFCTTTDGKEVVIDSYHADGKPDSANIGNWMVIYQEQYTFCNTGNETRAFVLNMKTGNSFVVALLVRDAEGNVIDKMLLNHGIYDETSFYSLDVGPEESRQITVEYVLLANSYGSVIHWVTVEEAGTQTSGSPAIYIPELNLTDRQTVSASSDLNISWQAEEAATSYTCIVVRLAGTPDPSNSSESSLPGSVTVYKNTAQAENYVTIPKADLMSGYWYKIAVAAQNGTEQSWKSIYIYIN